MSPIELFNAIKSHAKLKGITNVQACDVILAKSNLTEDQEKAYESLADAQDSLETEIRGMKALQSRIVESVLAKV